MTDPNGPSANPGPDYQQPPYAGYAEPEGPAGQIGNPAYSLYAPSAYAGQHVPAIVDPVAHDYGYSAAPGGQVHPQAVASLVLGVLGLVAFVPLAPIAWYLAAKARRETEAEPYRWQPSGMITAGMVLGIIGSVLLGLIVVVGTLVILLLAVTSG